MTKILTIFGAALLSAAPAFAQMGGGPGGQSGSGASLDPLFESNPVFSAAEVTTYTTPGGPITSTARMYFDHGNARTEMNMADAQGAGLPPGAAEQMKAAKAIGLDEVVMINPASKTNYYTVYPNLKAYFSTPIPPTTGTNNIQMTKIGDEAVNGHPCTKNNVTLATTGAPQITTWNATDLKNFPVQISLADGGMTAKMTFQDISFAPVPASQFQPPAGYTRYNDLQSLMQAVLMAHGATASPPPPH